MSRGQRIRWYESRRPGRGYWECSLVPPLLRSPQTAPRSEKPKNVSIGQRSLRCWSEHTWGKRGRGWCYTSIQSAFIICISTKALHESFDSDLVSITHDNKSSPWYILEIRLYIFPKTLLLDWYIIKRTVLREEWGTADSGYRNLEIMFLYFSLTYLKFLKAWLRNKMAIKLNRNKHLLPWRKVSDVCSTGTT